jgi:hypothetical protein
VTLTVRDRAGNTNTEMFLMTIGAVSDSGETPVFYSFSSPLIIGVIIFDVIGIGCALFYKIAIRPGVSKGADPSGRSRQDVASAFVHAHSSLEDKVDRILLEWKRRF